MYKVYMWVNTVNGKRYIGTTKDTLEKRAGKDGYHYQGSPRFYAAIKFYGFASFKGYILEDGLTKDQAAAAEKRYIQMYDTMNLDKGYNLQDGGFPEYETDQSARAEKISKTLKEERSSAEYRKVMSSRMQRVWDDPEKRAQILARRKGKPTGRPHIAVYCVELDTWFSNMTACAKAVGMHTSCLCVGLQKHGGKYISGGHGGPRYTFITKNVHDKEGELLEASAGDAGGNQQPSSYQMEFDF